MTCKTCMHYTPARNPETGRVMPRQKGQCTFSLVLPPVPFWFRIASHIPWWHDMWASDPGPCATYQPTVAGKAAIRKAARTANPPVLPMEA